MKKDLLLKLADLLDTVPNEQFDYTRWVCGELGKVGACGTAACALGWATMIPETGLRVVPGCPPYGVGLYGKPHSILHESIPFNEDDFTAVRGIRSACAAFDIDTYTAEALFYPGNWCESVGARSPNDTAYPAEVAHWIRQVVAAEGGES